MQHLRRIAVIILLVWSGRAAVAQNAHLRITGLVNFPDTALQGVSYPIGFRLQNIGLSPFTGPLQVILQTDSLYDILYFSQNPNFALFPNDTITLYANQGGVLGYQFSPQVFKPGNDVVVVWPYSTQMGVDYDSIYTAVYFVPLSTIAGQDKGEISPLKVYPNPFSDKIFLETDANNFIERVRIFSLDGSLVFDESRDFHQLKPSGLQPGAYLMEITTEGYRRFVKLVKTP